MFSGSEGGGSWNEKVGATFMPRDSGRRSPSHIGNQQSRSDLERLRFLEICESFKPMAWPFLRASAEVFDELSGKIARRARNLELQPLAPRS